MGSGIVEVLVSDMGGWVAERASPAALRGREASSTVAYVRRAMEGPSVEGSVERRRRGVVVRRVAIAASSRSRVAQRLLDWCF